LKTYRKFSPSFGHDPPDTGRRTPGWQQNMIWKAFTIELRCQLDAVLKVNDRPPVDGRIVCVQLSSDLNSRPRVG
jgi:hypothetical protein